MYGSTGEITRLGSGPEAIQVRRDDQESCCGSLECAVKISKCFALGAAERLLERRSLRVILVVRPQAEEFNGNADTRDRALVLPLSTSGGEQFQYPPDVLPDAVHYHLDRH